MCRYCRTTYRGSHSQITQCKYFLLIPVVFRGCALGADDQGPAALSRDRPVWDGGLPKRGLQTAAAPELSWPAIFGAGLLLGHQTPRKSFAAAATPVASVIKSSTATICLNELLVNFRWNELDATQFKEIVFYFSIQTQKIERKRITIIMLQ